MYYFSSDTHFNDKQNLKFDFRPFKNPKQFDKYVIKTWNKQAKKDDTIFVIGDFFSCNENNRDSWRKVILYIKKIKANVILITGNNEERVIKWFFNNNFDEFKKYCLSLGFKDVYKNLTLSFKGKEFYLTHKPADYKEGIINLFGHMHRAGGVYKPFGLNIGCDLNHFRLYSEDDIFFMLELKNIYWNKDKHLNMIYKGPLL